MSIVVDAGRPDTKIHQWLHSPLSPLPVNRAVLDSITEAMGSEMMTVICAGMAEAGVQSFVMTPPPLVDLVLYGCGCDACHKKTGVSTGDEEERRKYWMSEEVVMFYLLVASSNAFATRITDDCASVNTKLMSLTVGSLMAMQCDCVAQMDMQTSDAFEPLRAELASKKPNVKLLVDWVYNHGQCTCDASRTTLSQIGALEVILWNAAICRAVSKESDTYEPLVKAENIFSSKDLVQLPSTWIESGGFIADWFKQQYTGLCAVSCGPNAHLKQNSAPKFKHHDLYMPLRKALWKAGEECVTGECFVHPAGAVLNMIAMYRASFLVKKKTSDERADQATRAK